MPLLGQTHSQHSQCTCRSATLAGKKQTEEGTKRVAFVLLFRCFCCCAANRKFGQLVYIQAISFLCLLLFRLYHELTDAFAAYLDTDATCDSSASVPAGVSPTEAPPSEALTPEGKLQFLWRVVVGLQQHLDAIRLLKMCNGVLADIRKWRWPCPISYC